MCCCRAVKGLSSVIVQLVESLNYVSFVQNVIHVPVAASDLPVDSRLDQVWETWAALCVNCKVIRILRAGYTLPFQIQPILARSPIILSGYVHPLRNSNLTEALHVLMQNNAVEQARSKKSLGFFNQLFLILKPNNHWRPIYLSTLKHRNSLL